MVKNKKYKRQKNNFHTNKLCFPYITKITTRSKKKKKKSKMAVSGGLTNSCEMKRSEKQRRKGKVYSFECRVPKNSKER